MIGLLGITKTVIECSGPDPKSEHPKVYLTVFQGSIRCPYCSTEYQAKPEKETKAL